MKKIILTVLVSMFWVGIANALPFQNGSFEIITENFPGDANGSRNTATSGVSSTVFAGWNIIAGNIDYIHNNYWQASAGNYSLDLSGWGPATISQSFDTIVGQEYLVLFDMAGNSEGQPLEKMLNVTVGWDDQLYTFITTPGSNANMNWDEKSYFFFAQDTTTTLWFQSMVDTAYGPALDNVQLYKVEPVPEPATMLLFVTGLAGFAGTRIRRNKNA